MDSGGFALIIVATPPQTLESSQGLSLNLAQSPASTHSPELLSALDHFLDNPLNNSEWVDDELLEKTQMTAKTGRIQARLAYFWTNHMITSGQGGEVYTETHCRTIDRVRCPDVAYLTPDLVQEQGDFKVLPQSFPLVAEIVSPTDIAEEIFAKVREYLESQCQEVWLIFPASQWVLGITSEQQHLWGMGAIAATQTTLQGFQVPVEALIA
jgi:Uma2 family endonuclease